MQQGFARKKAAKISPLKPIVLSTDAYKKSFFYTAYIVKFALR
jgi:hypothetical protein